MINKTKSILKSNFPIILASNSESRLKILYETGIDFKQLKSNIDESFVKEKYKKKNANFIATKLAEAKALFISSENRKYYVIGADQICISKGKIFSKPKNKKTAFIVFTFEAIKSSYRRYIKLLGYSFSNFTTCCIESNVLKIELKYNGVGAFVIFLNEHNTLLGSLIIIIALEFGKISKNSGIFVQTNWFFSPQYFIGCFTFE